MKAVILQWKDSEESLRTKCKDYGARLKRLPVLTRSVVDLLQTKGRMPVRCSDGLCTVAHKIAIYLLADNPDKAVLQEVFL